MLNSVTDAEENELASSTDGEMHSGCQETARFLGRSKTVPDTEITLQERLSGNLLPKTGGL